MWSSPMAVMIASSGVSMTLVESSAPPMPTSSTTMSHRLRAKYSMARQVMSSNSVGCCGIASACGYTSVVSAASVSSGMGCPSTCIRSLNRSINGEMYSPTRYPAARRMDAIMADVLPLPLVPATWTNRSDRSGWPSRRSSSCVRERPGMLPRHATVWIYASASS